MTSTEVARLVDDAGLRLVRFLWCGNDGTIRAKASARHGLEGRLEHGIGITTALQAMNALDQLQPVDGLGPVGDFRLKPALETFRPLPYVPRTGAVLTDLVGVDGEPAPLSQRAFLKRMQARLAEYGLELRVGFENEFTLARKAEGGALQPLDTALGLSTVSMSAAQKYVDALVSAFDKQRISLGQYAAELGPGQQVISTAHAPALRAADEQILVRETIRGVAAGEELVASLAPKPWPDVPGNGARIHFSLWQGERNRFYEDGGLSELARTFTAGVLAHLRGLVALTAPSFSSYRRLVPGAWAGAFTAWGHDNRETPLRAVSPLAGAEMETTHVELRAADASSNPYLALGGLIAAGLDGVERSLPLPDPVSFDPGRLNDWERGERSIERLPSNQYEALDALAGDAVLTSALGPELADAYLAVRRSEWAVYSQADAAFEQQGHFDKY